MTPGAAETDAMPSKNGYRNHFTGDHRLLVVLFLALNSLVSTESPCLAKLEWIFLTDIGNESSRVLLLAQRMPAPREI